MMKAAGGRNGSWVVEAPSSNVYNPDCLRWVEDEIPRCPDGMLLVRTLLLSLDPTSRNWLKLEPRMQIVPFSVGDPMIGIAVGQVVESQAPGFVAGDIVTGLWGWQRYAVARSTLVERIAQDAAVPLEARLSVFSHVGRAAIMGLVGIGSIKSADAVLISGAAGATGSLAVQIAKAHGCRVVAIAGGAEKCRYVVETLGADAAIDYRHDDVGASLSRLFPSGIDVFFDNVGGAILDQALLHMALGCRIVVSGAISQYDVDPSQVVGVRNLQWLIFRSAKLEGFVVTQFASRYAEFDQQLLDLYRAGRLIGRSHVVDGLQNAPEALRMIFSGENRGKLMVRVAELESNDAGVLETDLPATN